MGRSDAGYVVVEAAPPATFEVVEAELALHLLVVALDSPTKLREVHEPLQRGLGRQVRQIQLAGLLLATRPLAEKPHVVTRGGATRMPVR